MPYKALIIEDEPIVAALVCTALQRSQLFDCVVVPRLRAAWGLIEENGIDLIFLDKTLHDSEGFEGLREILRRAPDIPVVVGTGDNDSAKVMHALRLGAQDYLMKPYNTDTLVGQLERAIGRQRYVNKLRDATEVRVYRRSKVDWVLLGTGAVAIIAEIFRWIK